MLNMVARLAFVASLSAFVWLKSMWMIESMWMCDIGATDIVRGSSVTLKHAGAFFHINGVGGPKSDSNILSYQDVSPFHSLFTTESWAVKCQPVWAAQTWYNLNITFVMVVWRPSNSTDSHKQTNCPMVLYMYCGERSTKTWPLSQIKMVSLP